MVELGRVLTDSIFLSGLNLDLHSQNMNIKILEESAQSTTRSKHLRIIYHDLKFTHDFLLQHLLHPQFSEFYFENQVFCLLEAHGGDPELCMSLSKRTSGLTGRLTGKKLLFGGETAVLPTQSQFYDLLGRSVVGRLTQIFDDKLQKKIAPGWLTFNRIFAFFNPEWAGGDWKNQAVQEEELKYSIRMVEELIG